MRTRAEVEQDLAAASALLDHASDRLRFHDHLADHYRAAVAGQEAAYFEFEAELAALEVES